MTALASTDVAISMVSGGHDFAPDSLKKSVLADITFGDAALTYPTGGVPLPAKEQFGFSKELQLAVVEPPPANGFAYKVDRENHKLKIFTQGVVTGSTAATDSASGALAENSAAAEGSVRLMGTAVDTTYDLGPMIELPSTIAPAETTLRLYLIGE